MDVAPDDSDIRFGVVGLGYVGLPLSLSLARAGYDVVGVDTDRAKVARLRDGRSSIDTVEDDEISSVLGEGFEPTADYEALDDVTAISLCVPTPLRKTGQPDVSYIVEAAERLAEVLPPDCTVILESTVYPGTTEEILEPILTESGRRVGEDVYLAFSPERIDPGNDEFEITEIPKVLGGVTEACRDRAEALYSPVFDEIVTVQSSTEAEFVKLLENSFRSVNIGLINEFAMIAHEFDADIWNIIEAASSKPFGFLPFYPGPGFGGHCIPVDPMYLSWKARQQGTKTRFIDLANEINHEMPKHVLQRLTEFLNRAGVPLRDATVLVVGVSYKPGVSDTRASPAYDVIEMLADRGVEVSYHDPHVPEYEVEGISYASVPLEPERLEGTDATVILTAHPGIDYQLVVRHAPLVFDTRNAIAEANEPHVHRL